MMAARKAATAPATKKDRRGSKKGQFGIRAFEPTAEQRKQVSTYVAVGIPQETIALLLDISVDTLDRHFRRELDTGTARANAQVAGKLFQKALGGDTASMIFWLKTRAKWSEKVAVEHSGPEGGSIPVGVSVDEVLKRLRELDDEC